jgi:hypothetical protein
MDGLAKELATYAAKLPSLLSQQGKYAVIKGDEIAGIFDTYSDALKFGYERFSIDQFLVKQISATERVSYISRHVQPCHQSICQ